MKITISEAEIKTAIINYVSSQGLNTEGRKVTIDLKATRGPEGYTADIEVTDPSVEDVAGSTESGEASAQPERPLGIVKRVTAAKPALVASTDEAEAEAAAEQLEADANEAAEAETDAGEGANAGEAGNEEEAAKPRSIFASAKRPVNA